MKKSHRLLLMGLVLWNIQLLAQTIPENPNLTIEGKQEGKWTIWYNKNFKPTSIRDSVVYYRLITYQAGKPAGVVKDYYRSGIIQWEGNLIAEQPIRVIEGTATMYYENGNKKRETEYEGGKPKQTTSFNEDGTVDTFATAGMQSAIYLLQGNSEKAESLLLQALENGRYQSGEYHPDYANALTALAQISLTNRGNYEKAEALFLEALELKKKQVGENHLDLVPMLSPLASMYMSMGRYDQAEPLYVQCLQIRAQLGESHRDYLLSLAELAHLYQSMGKYEKAEPLFVKNLQITRSQKGENDIMYSAWLLSLAELYLTMGRYEKAEPLFLQAAKIGKAKISEAPMVGFVYAMYLRALARFYTVTGKVEKAEPLHIQALEILKSSWGESNPNYVASLIGLADLYYTMGRYEKAESLFLQILEARKPQSGEGNQGYGNIINGLGMLYRDMGRYEEAERLLMRSLQIRKTQGENHPDYTMVLDNLTLLYSAMGRYEKAEPLFIQAIENRISQLDRNFPFLSESEKEQFYKSTRDRIESFNAFGLVRYHQNTGIAGQMFNLQLYTKALLLNSSAKWKQRIRSSGDKKLFSLYTLWENKQTHFAKLFNETDSVKRKLLDSLQVQANAIEKELSHRSELFAQFVDKKKFTWEDVKHNLQPGDAAIEIIRLRKFGIKKTVVDSSSASLNRYPLYGLTDTVFYAALIVTPSAKQPKLVVLENGNELENRDLAYYRNCISSQTNDESSYNSYWKSIASVLGKRIKKIYFSPDGVYNSVNLNTLLNPKTKRYLLEETDVHLLTSTKDLLVAKKEENYNNLAYLFGHPDYHVSNEQRASLVKKDRSSQPVYYSLTLDRVAALSELPGTKTEVENIAAMLSGKGWQPEVLTGDKALEETLKDSFKPRVLHIATHGYFQSDSILSVRGNPLLQSGLMLTGAGRTLAGDKDEKTEDGILTAYEAMNLNLDNTDLVVLSACETGLGEIRNGEGVYGLQRAFKVAGAKSIIMSLWKVNDEATQELLTAFYKYWLESGNKRDAFKKAQLSIQAKYASPYYWGAFVMVGE